MVSIATRYTERLRHRNPRSGRQWYEVVLIGHLGQASQHVTQIRQRVFAVALAGDDNRVNDRTALAGVGMANEQPVLLSDSRGPNRIFDEVVVQPGLPVVEMGSQRRPLGQQVVAGFAQCRLGQYALPQAQGKFVQPVQRATVTLAMFSAFFHRKALLVPAPLRFVERADDPQDQAHSLGLLRLGLKKLPPGMRPTTDPGDPGMRLGIRAIGAVAVGLQDAGKAIDQGKLGKLGTG
jgi:hypothetical protein